MLTVKQCKDLTKYKEYVGKEAPVALLGKAVLW